MSTHVATISYIRLRIFVLLILFLSAYGFLTVRLINVQYLSNARYVAQAKQQQGIKVVLPAQRGQIVDRFGKILAISVPVRSVFCVPTDVRDPTETALRLAPVLGLETKFLLDRLQPKPRKSADPQDQKPCKFSWLKRRISDAELAALSALGHVDGVETMEESTRVYPNGPLMSQVVGFVDIDNVGREGVEAVLDKELAGCSGFRISRKDAKGREILSKTQQIQLPVNGLNVQLTLDQTVQHIAERELDWGVEQFHPEGAVAVVMDVATGDLLALANRPTFNPNDVGRSDAAARRNRTVADTFEPGSVFKVVAFSGALNERVLRPDDMVFCENGVWRLPHYTLHDTHRCGTLRVAEVFAKSSNIGTAKIAARLGADKLYAYARAFGIGASAGTGFPGETPGLLRPVSRWSGVSIYSIPIGQEVCVNAVQLVRAYAVVASGGKLLQPRLFKQIARENGTPQRVWDSGTPARVISPETCRQMVQMMRRVVSDEGNGKKAAVEGYHVAGKTGTAQKPFKDRRGYSHEDFYSSFIGFLPAENPKVCIGVVFDAPKPVYYGGSVAAPVFSRIAQALMAYLGVPPVQEGGAA